MEGGDAYSNKADQFMKEAQKILKGKHSLTQVHSLAILCLTKPNVLSRQLNFLSRLQPTTNLPNAGMTQQEHTFNASNAIKCVRVDKLPTSTRRLPMSKKK